MLKLLDITAAAAIAAGMTLTAVGAADAQSRGVVVNPIPTGPPPPPPIAAPPAPSATAPPAPPLPPVAPLSPPLPPPVETGGGVARQGSLALTPGRSRDKPGSMMGGGGRTLANCMGFWDPATHMTKQEWKASCQRTLNRVNLIPAIKP